MKKSRLKWLAEKRQKAIYNHFVYNGTQDGQTPDLVRTGQLPAR
jgi:hypothetical protein